MADWPRWIDDARVDSAAMLSAFEAFCVREPDYSRGFQDLFVIVHRCNYQIAPAWTLPSRRCQALSCRRCEQGSGGYQFRWWHRSWESDYEKLCRRGAWKRNELQATQESSFGAASVSPDLVVWLHMKLIRILSGKSSWGIRRYIVVAVARPSCKQQIGQREQVFKNSKLCSDCVTVSVDRCATEWVLQSACLVKCSVWTILFLRRVGGHEQAVSISSIAAWTCISIDSVWILCPRADRAYATDADRLYMHNTFFSFWRVRSWSGCRKLICNSCTCLFVDLIGLSVPREITLLWQMLMNFLFVFFF